jgi:hypothetical protein
VERNAGRSVERALFISKRRNTRYFAEQFTRLYFGNEFCQRLLPSDDDIHFFLDFVLKRESELTLVTPYVTDEGLKRVRRLVRILSRERPTAEVVFNDWGVLRVLEKEGGSLKPVLGRLLTKTKRGPRLLHLWDRLPKAAQEFFQGTNLTVPMYRRFLTDHGVTRAELDNPFQELSLAGIGEEISLSLYVPFAYVTTTRFCLVASCDVPERKGMVGVFPCKTECQKYTFYLRHPVMPATLIRRGNTLFYKNDVIPRNLKGMGINRLVVEPEVPL